MEMKLYQVNGGTGEREDRWGKVDEGFNRLESFCLNQKDLSSSKYIVTRIRIYEYI